jgi:hypothetical protein
MFQSYNHLQAEIYTPEINMTFFEIIRYMIRSYDHIQVEIYASEIKLKMVVRPKHVAVN